MVALWMPGAQVHDIGNHAPMNGGPPRVVHHTTSNKTDHNWANEWQYLAHGGATEAPHLVADPFTGQVMQLLPADSRSMALQNDGSHQTNRTGKYCIQIEWVFTENETYNGKKYHSLAETPLKPWPAIHAWVKSLGVPDVWPGGAPKAWARQDVTLGTWENHGGHYGHCHVPGNSHNDPGPMPALFGKAPAPPVKPVVSLAHVVKAAHTDPPAPQGHLTYRNDVLLVEKALQAEGLLTAGLVDGSYGTSTITAYQKWQQSLGYKGKDADGIPGQASLTKLGDKHGWKVA